MARGQSPPPSLRFPSLTSGYTVVAGGLRYTRVDGHPQHALANPERRPHRAAEGAVDRQQTVRRPAPKQRVRAR